MKDVRNYRRQWLRNHDKYTKKGLTIFRKAAREAVNNIPFENLSEGTYQMSINFNIKEDHFKEAFLEFYTTIGIAHGKKVLRALKKEKDIFDDFVNIYRAQLSEWMYQYAGLKIKSITEELKDYIIKIITEGIKNEQDIRSIVRELKKHIKSRAFYRWQLMRIVRTETTTAANRGAIQAGNHSRIIWEKEWISANDQRTRRKPDDKFDHAAMDGVKVLKNEHFDVQGDKLEYPGDPKGNVANIVNCRCTVAIVPKRDENGRLIRL